MSQTLTLSVPSMTCGHCARTITRALADVGVSQASVDLRTKQVSLTADPAALPGILETLAAEGYEATPV